MNVCICPVRAKDGRRRCRDVRVEDNGTLLCGRAADLGEAVEANVFIGGAETPAADVTVDIAGLVAALRDCGLTIRTERRRKP